MSLFNKLLRSLLTLPKEKQEEWERNLRASSPKDLEKVLLYLKSHPAAPHEAQGYEHLLRRLGQKTFTRPFAPIQHRFWEWNWNALQKVQDGEALEPREKVGFLPWPRETGKSSTVEWACILEGALLKLGYVIYLCHEIGTPIYDEGLTHQGWAAVESHPSATLVEKETLRISVAGLPRSDGEYVTLEHQYWARRIAVRQVKENGQDIRYGEPHWIESRYLDWNTWIGYPIDYAVVPERSYPLLTKWKGGWRGGQYVKVEFPLFRNPDFWWMVGLWWGDGTLGGPKRGNISFSCGDAHPETRDRLVSLLKDWGYTIHLNRPKSGAALTDVVFSDRALAQWLSTWKRGRNRKEPPTWVEHLPSEYQIQLVRGYLAADGYEHDRGVTLTSIHLPGLLAVRRILARLDTTCTIASKRSAGQSILPGGRTCSVARSFTLQIAHPGRLGIYTNDGDGEGQRQVFIRDGFLWSRVTGVDDAGMRTVVPITTESETYLTAFGRSHNCGKLSQAIDHVVAIRDRIESEKVAELYPWLGKPKLGTHGNKFGWGQEFLMTSGGWAIRPVGADVAMRGGKAINIRPTLIVPDDYDELDDSPHVVEHKEHMLTRAILPMGDANTRVLVPQNPIHANSVVNRMLTGASLALAIRTVFGEFNDDGSLSSRPIPAVNGLVYEVRQSDEGPYSEITQGESNWPGISVADWNATLNRVGPEAFKAEYQHDMTVAQEERVLPEYDDRNLRLHVITWSQYEAKYEQRRVPSDWPCDVGLDIGYTGSHKSAWTFTTKVPAAYELAGSIFRYRGRTFTGIGIDEQAVSVRGELWPDEQVEVHLMSHEKLGERLVLNQKHGWHFQPCDSAKTAGIAQWRHFLRPDRSQPHPFHRDEKDINGLWRLGRPAWFDIVDDRQFHAPTDDHGLKRHRDGAFNWRQVPVKLTDKGLSVEQPAKMDDDECFVAGTMITTRRGETAIEHIQLNDVVLTRQGWRGILACGQTKSKAEIWTITLSSGYQLSGTRGHPIWVAGYGWKPLSELRVGEKLLSLTECDFTATPTRSTGRIGRILSRIFTPFARALALSMSSYGSRFTERCRRAIRFTTEITTRSITPIQILNYSPALNTAVTTDEIARLSILCGSGRIWRTCKNWLRSGTEARRAENGIVNMLRSLSVNLQELASRANTVAGSTSRAGGLESTVPRDASKPPSSKQKNWRNPSGYVNAAIRFIHWLMRGEDNALTVLRSEPSKQRQTVYNLSVECQPEYFANGVLVHNCDSTRMCLVRFGPVGKAMTQAQRVEAIIPSGYHRRELAQTRHPNDAQMTTELVEWLAKKALAHKKPSLVDPWGNPLR